MGSAIHGVWQRNAVLEHPKVASSALVGNLLDFVEFVASIATEQGWLQLNHQRVVVAYVFDLFRQCDTWEVEVEVAEIAVVDKIAVPPKASFALVGHPGHVDEG